MRRLITLCATTILILAVGSAKADMIDFESLGDLVPVDNQFLGLGADFNGLAQILSEYSGSLTSSLFPPNSGDKVIWNYDPDNKLITDIRVNAVGPEWLMAGGYVTGTANVTLKAYGSSGSELASHSTGGINLGDDANIFLHVSAANIAYVTFVGYSNTYTVDDFTFTPVPVPAAVLLGMLGLGVAGMKLRKFS